MSHAAAQTWTVWACPECHGETRAMGSNPALCYGCLLDRDKKIPLERVKVVPATALEAAEADRNEVYMSAERLRSRVSELEAALGKIANYPSGYPQKIAQAALKGEGRGTS